MNCFYRDKDPAIWRHPGRTTMNTALSAGVKGMVHLTWEGTRQDQILAYSGTRLFRAPIAAIGDTLAFVELSAPGAVLGTITSTTTFTAATTAIASCTIVGTAVSTTNSFAGLKVGMTVSGTGVTAGTKIASITSTTALVLDTAAANATVTLTFSANPFTADIVGALCYFTASSNTPNAVSAQVTAVSGSPDSDGHYPAVTLSQAQTNGDYTIAFQFGVSTAYANAGADANHAEPTESLDAAFYGSSYLIWTGLNSPSRVEWRKRASLTGSTNLEDTLVVRPTGMLPVQTPFTASTLSGTDANGDAYTWPTGAAVGTYWFLLTEMMEYSLPGQVTAAEVEGSYLGEQPGAAETLVGVPVSASIINHAQAIQITTPNTGARNNGSDNARGRLATHWCVYMYGPSDERPSLAAFRRVAKYPIAQTTTGYGVSQTLLVSDSRRSQFYVFPTVAVAGPTDGKPAFANEAGMLGIPLGGGAFGFSNGTGYAKTAAANTLAPYPVDAVSNLKTFKNQAGTALDLTAPWASRPVSGITVGIVGAVTPVSGGPAASYYFYLVNHAGDKRTPYRTGTFTSGDIYTQYHGGETDKLGVNWVTADFGADFRVVIGKTASTTAKEVLRIDAITLFVHWSSGSIDFNGKPYRVVTFRDQIGVTVNDPANIPLRDASTGDFFQGSFVSNDLGDDTAIRFSLPTDPEAQPKPYVMRFNSVKRDKVRYIKSLGQILLVGMNESIKRVNYLPRETDTDLQTGLAHEDIATDHGIAGPRAAVRFDWPGRGTLIAYASSAGIFATDGIVTHPLNLDLAWSSLVKLSALGSSVFKCYPKEKMLALYYCPAGATHNLNTRVMYFCYQADKIKQGGYLPAIGPSVVSAKCALDLSINGTPYLFTGHESDGYIYREDNGTTIPAAYRARLQDDTGPGDGFTSASVVVNVPRIRTRKFYPAGIERDARESRIYLLYDAYGSSGVSGTATTLSNGNQTVASAAAWGSVVAGMSVYGTGVPPGTYVLSVASSSSITLSAACDASTAGAVLTFDTGTLVATVRGSGIRGTTAGMSRSASSTVIGDLLVLHSDNGWQGLELDIEKVPIAFSADNDNVRFNSSQWADLGTEMRLHQFTWLISDNGLEQNRAS